MGSSGVCSTLHRGNRDSPFFQEIRVCIEQHLPSHDPHVHVYRFGVGEYEKPSLFKPFAVVFLLIVSLQEVPKFEGKYVCSRKAFKKVALYLGGC